MTEAKSDTYRGWLFKWTNYIKGYQRRWFVLANGYLSYYRSQQEMSHTCRGTINVAGARISSEDNCSFTISSGTSQVWHLKTTTEVERQRWITTLELARAGKPNLESGTDNTDSDSDEDDPNQGPDLKQLQSKLEDLQTCHDLIKKHSTSLSRVVNDLDDDVSRALQEKSTLFLITSDAMNVAASEFLQISRNTHRHWDKLLNQERQQRRRLEETVEALAHQQNALEKGTGNNDKNQFPQANEIQSYAETTDGSDDEFHDCEGEDDLEEEDQVQINEKPIPTQVNPIQMADNGKRKRRTHIPDKPEHPLNLWSIMKSCIGKDLSKIPMPVNFNEPLSMLQRITEDFEYYKILDKAAAAKTTEEQVALVAAFSVSSYASTLIRTTKPFNPLLGETYELDRVDEMGLRLIVEQVSHHPPSAAFHAISTHNGGWELWGEMTVTSKFRGKYLSVTPLGNIQVKFNNNGQHYHWNRVTTTVHNIIVGKLWIEQSGEYAVASTKTQHKCKLKYHPYSYFSREQPRRVTGTVHNDAGKPVQAVQGTWDESISLYDITKYKDPSNMETTNERLLWEKNPLPKGSEKRYHFSDFTITLNEQEPNTAPTDSRLRKDQQLMEETKWDEANTEKQRLEQAQRERRKTRTEPWEPAWFKQEKDPATNEMMYIYKGNYWDAKDKQDWSKCPQIFN
jgi:hypothetical protein